MPDRARFVINIALLLLITLLARPASAYVLSSQTNTSNLANSSLPKLSAPSKSREGYFVLSLSASPTQNLIVEYSADESFREIERMYPWFGDFQRMTLTGFGDGNHYFRIRSVADESGNLSPQNSQLNNQPSIEPSIEPSNHVSNVVRVQVDHYALEQAFTLFALGGLLFVILVVIILYQHRRRSRTHE
ncbi:MAG: hypothetical protein B7X54_10360 [Idiomarina sp. 34-48-12]|nr:MAG: hypothetical protein B7X54_10360 [Idiomarina sp. 34-48-12]